MRALFDTNVLLSAFISEGLCSKLLSRAKKKQFALYTCPFVLSEFREKLTRKFSATVKEADETAALIEGISVTANPATKMVVVTGICRDSDDDNVLACALAANVDYLVTGDPDLLIIETYQGIKIVSPREFELLFDNP